MDSIYEQPDNTIIYSDKGYSKVHKTRSHQTFIRVQMFPHNRKGKVTGNMPKGMKFKLHMGSSINIMPISTYKYKQVKPINGHGPDRPTVKNYNSNTTQQYGMRIILGKWNN